MTTDKHVPVGLLKLIVFNSKVRYRSSNLIERDTTCDSKYMNDAMRRVAVAMREKNHWALMSTRLKLVIDNSGGYGTG